MNDDSMTHRIESAPRGLAGRDYLWFALLLLVMLAGAADH